MVRLLLMSFRVLFLGCILADIGINHDAFRAGIRRAMLMGMPAEEERWPKFRIVVSEQQYSGPVDSDGVPYDLGSVVVEPAVYRYERPLCAIETSGSEDSPWLTPGQVLFTFLDEEYEQVRGFDQVELWLGGAGSGSALYLFDRIVAQPTLSAVGVWQVLCRTEDGV